MINKKSFKEIELIIGNSNRNFSGVTSITLQLLKEQSRLKNIAVLGKHYVPETYTTINFFQFLLLTRTKHSSDRPRVFFARRNNEMLQAIIAKYFFRSKIKIIFNSTAQRNHTRFTKWLMSKMDSIISTSDKAASFLDNPPDIIIPHGIDTSRFNPPENKNTAWKELGFPGSFGIGLFGRVRYSKGVDILVDACLDILKENKEATVLICGETQVEDLNYKKMMISKITEAHLEDRIIFLGKKTFEELPFIFKGMSIVVALSRNEGYGLTPFEGMASGAAVLTSEAGAWKELVRDGIDGYVVKTDNVEQTREKLLKMINNFDETERMGQEASKYVNKKFTIEEEARKIIDHINHVQVI